MFHVRGSLGKAKGVRGPGRGLSLSLSAGSTRRVYARSMTAASRDPYRSVSRSGHWLAILESGVLLVHTGALRDRCAPRWGLRCVSTWAWTTRLPVGSAPPAIGSFGRPRRLRARAFDRAHIDVVDIDVVDIDVVDIDVVVTRLAPQLASQLPPRAARAARAWNERRRRTRSPTASTTSPRRRHLALRLSRGARAQSARRSRHVARSPPLLGAAAAARVARAARVAPPLVGAPFLELDVAPRHEPRRIGARQVNWRRAGARVKG